MRLNEYKYLPMTNTTKSTTSSIVGDSGASEGKVESKDEVFESLLNSEPTIIGHEEKVEAWKKDWRERYAKAEIFGRSYYEKLSKKADEDCLCEEMTEQEQLEGQRCDSCKAGGIINMCSELMYDEVHEQGL